MKIVVSDFTPSCGVRRDAQSHELTSEIRSLIFFSVSAISMHSPFVCRARVNLSTECGSNNTYDKDVNVRLNLKKKYWQLC
jgi:hypothetical protein